MQDNYFPAKFEVKEFHCVFCNVYTHHEWFTPIYLDSFHKKAENVRFCKCIKCSGLSLWNNQNMVFPEQQPIVSMHQDLPSSIKGYYEEALAIFYKSPRGATALLRLAIQQLMSELGEKGKNINDDIKALVTKGLPVKIQKALDYCRVVGNNAVHPGEINVDDTPEIAEALFKMINFIVDEVITKPKEIDELYNLLPEGAREAIEKRDLKNKDN